MTIATKLERALTLAKPARELLGHWGTKKLIVELAIPGELPYILPLLKHADRLPGIRLVLVPSDDRALEVDQVRRALQPISDNFSILRRDDVQSLSRWIRFDGFLTSEQFSKPLLRPSICIFHGQPSKGITFTKRVVDSFDHFFHLGPLHHKAFDEFVDSHEIERSSLPESHAIGYPKTDELLGGLLSHNQQIFDDRLSEFDKKILYAPAFNEHCTLRTIGTELIETLSSLAGTCVIVKLAPDSIERTDNVYATGGVDWPARIESLGLENVFIATDLDIGPFIAIADVMVTDVSGVGYEFLATGKPVVYFECLDFYEQVVLSQNPDLSLDDLLSRDTINGGRRYGTVVRSLEELTTALTKPLPTPCAQTMQQRLLYNPGSGTQAMLEALTRLFAR